MKIRYLIVAFLFLSSTSNAQVEGEHKPPPETDENRVFNKVEQEAAFSGGDQGWRRFLEKTLNASVPVDNGAPSGKYTVRVQFIVSKDGSVSDVKAITHHGYGMEEECIKAIKKSGRWTPAMQNGQPVNAYRIQPITFEVVEDDYDEDINPNYRYKNDEIAIDEPAAFPGGREAWAKYLYQNVRTEELAKKIKFPKENYILKRVFMQALIKTNGTLSEIEVLDKDIDPLLKSEALRVIKKSPKWIPAKKDGKPVSTHKPLSILFDIRKK